MMIAAPSIHSTLASSADDDDRRVTPNGTGARLTRFDFRFECVAGRMVEREDKRNESTDNQYNKCHILKRFEHQLKECLRWLRWNFVAAERSDTHGKISLLSSET